MKYMIMTLLAVGCGSDEAAEKSTEVAPAEQKVAAEKPVAANVEKSGKDANSGHEGMDHGKMDAGAHIGPVPEGAKVYFVSPADGATVTSPVKIQMGVDGMEVQPAGKIQDGSGHHHIVIDADSVAKGTLVPADDKHKHFGKGQTETELQLAPGQHTLQLQFANGVHLSYGEQMSSKITITVE
jgi:hypothetical protein